MKRQIRFLEHQRQTNSVAIKRQKKQYNQHRRPSLYPNTLRTEINFTA
jgi:hypothetical protein